MPPARVWTSLRYSAKRFFAEGRIVAAARQNHVDSDLKETPTAGYAIAALKAGCNVGKLYLVGSVDNVLNRFYYEHFSYSRDPFRSGVKVPEPGRAVWIMISYRL